MNISKLMKELYKIFINDETLLRYLYYSPENQSDDPLSPTKPDILSLPPKEKFDIINEVIYFTDKKLALDLKTNFSRINFYLGNRVPERKYSSGARQLINNPLVSRQEIHVDIHTNMEINAIDFRIFDIQDRVNKLLLNKNVGQFTGLKFDYGHNIEQTANGFVGYRLIYYVKSSQFTGSE